MEQIKYLLGSLINLPLFPILYWQGKQVYKTVPRLPEAETPYGIVGNGDKVIKLLSIGESTIAGVGVEKHEQGYTGHLSKSLAKLLQKRVSWEVVAKSGYTAKKVTDRLLPKIKNTDQDIIIVGLGGNDTFKLRMPKNWEKDIEKLIDALKVKFPNTPIVFINVPPIRSFPAFSKTIKFVLGRQVDLLRDVLQKVVIEYENVWFINEQIKLKIWLNHFEEEQYTAKDFFSDGVHPSELTYKTWAEESAKFILKKEILI